MPENYPLEITEKEAPELEPSVGEFDLVNESYVNLGKGLLENESSKDELVSSLSAFSTSLACARISFGEDVTEEDISSYLSDIGVEDDLKKTIIQEFHIKFKEAKKRIAEYDKIG